MKKIVAVLLAMVLLASMSVAFAVPSKTTSDLDKVKKVEAAEGVTVPADLAVEVAEDTPETIAALANVAEKLNGGAKLSEVFGVEVDDKLAVNEFCTLKTSGYTSEVGALKMTMATATAYKDGQTVKALILVDGEWTEIEAEVIDGEVVVNLPAEILEKINGQSVALAILG